MKFLLVLLFLFLNCNSLSKYIVNRANDLKDIPIFGVEKDVYGFNTVTLIPVFGVAYNKNGKGLGIRHSHIGIYRVGDPDNKITFISWLNNRDYESDTYFGNTFLTANSFHEPMNPDNKRVSNKTYKVVPVIRCRFKSIIRYKDDVQTCHYYDNVEFYPIELSLGLFLGVRVGFSAGELVDFLVGIIGFDPMDDDLAGAIPVYRELPQPTSQNENWESKVDALDETINNRGKK